MSRAARGYVAAAALLLALATIAGALAAHALKARLPADQLDVLQTAVRYQFFHALGLLGLALLLERMPVRVLHVAAALLTAGIVLFSGSLYALVAGLHGTLATAVGVLTPIGGVCLIIAWLLVAAALVQARRPV